MKYAAILLSAIFLCFYPVHNSYSQSIENDFLVIRGDKETGRIQIATKKGNPDISGDDNRNITSGGAGNKYKSFLTVLVDNKAYPIGENTQYPVKVEVLGDILTTTVELPMKIHVIQIVKLTQNEFTGRKDGVEISFLVKNQDDKAHNIRLRYVMDTDMDNFANSGFMLIDGTKINSETAYIDNVPSKIYMVENTQNIQQSSLNFFLRFTPSEILPYRLAISGYNKFRSASFEFKPIIGVSFAAGSDTRDAAMGIYYQLGRMLPNQERKVSMALGIHPQPVPRKSDFSHSIELLPVVKKPPLEIRLNVKNTGAQILRIIKAELHYPEFLRFSGDINVIQSAVNVKPGESKTFIWKFVYSPDIFKYIRFKFIIKSYNEDMQLTVKQEQRDVLLSAERDIRGQVSAVHSLQMKQILNELNYLNQILELSRQEMVEINFILEKIDAASHVENYIAGQRMISESLFADLKRQFQLLLYKIALRKKTIQEIERMYRTDSRQR